MKKHKEICEEIRKAQKGYKRPWALAPQVAWYRAHPDMEPLTIRLEHIERDLAALPGDLTRFGVKQHNASGVERPWQEFYDPQTEARVRQLYAEDFEAFGYADRVDDAEM